MEMEKKVKLVFLMLVCLFVLNSVLIFGQAKNKLQDTKKVSNGDYPEIEKNYESSGVFKQRDDYFGYANDFEIYVKNLGKGDYFDVKIYIKTAEGKETKRFHRYIFSGEEERFYFREITREKLDVLGWEYYVE